MESVAIKFVGRTPKPRSAFVGMHGEHNVEQIVFSGIPEFEDGIVTMNVVLPDGTAGDTLNVEDNTVVLTRTYTQMSGQWTAWIVVQVGTEMVWKSDVFRLIVMPLPEIEEIMDQQYPTALEEMLAKADEAIASAGAAQEAKEEAEAAVTSANEAVEQAAGYALTAGRYAGTADDARIDAEAARDAAQGAVTNAEAAEQGARRYAGAAQGYAGEAAISAEAAAQSAADAENQATLAGSQATAAAGSAGEAERYAAAAQGSAEGAGNQAAAAAGHAETARERAADARGYAQTASGYADSAEGHADNAALHDLSAEAWAVGTKAGQAVPSGEAQYQNNAKYWAGEAESTAEELREAMEDLPQETTGEALLEALIHGTDMTDTVLTVAGMYLDALPQDESGTDIRDALHLEADRLAALYEIWEAERS